MPRCLMEDSVSTCSQRGHKMGPEKPGQVTLGRAQPPTEESTPRSHSHTRKAADTYLTGTQGVEWPCWLWPRCA